VSNKVAAVEPSVEGAPSAAEAAGLQPGDEIIGVGGLETTDWEEIREFIREHAGEQVAFSVRRDGEVVELEAELGSALFDADDQLVEYAPFGEQLRPPGAGEELVGFLGVQPDIEFQKEGLIGAAGDSAGRTWEVTKLSFRGIGETATMVFGGELWDALRGEGQRELDEGPLGIVGAGRFASESVESGRLLDLVGLIVGFTVFVGLMNLLPLPPLDGGYLAVLAYESITRKTVDVRKLIPVAAAVISFFVILFVAVLYLDLARPIKVPF
jgi:RIP metalloprotease RseP